MTHEAIEAELAGARARLASSCRPFAAYAGVHLAPLRVSDDERPVVSATLRWHEGQPPADRVAADPVLATMERVDRDLYRSEGRLAWYRIDDLPDLQLRFVWDGERLQVTGDFYYRVSARPGRDQLKRLLYRRRLPALRQRRYTTLLYYLLYYPCFWWLERRRGRHPIHAAGVEMDGAVVLLAGPSGVGKSTLATGLAAGPGARLLSDTFLLQRGASVYAVPEPLLLDKWSREWLGDGANHLQPLDWRYCLNRGGFHWAADRQSPGGEARLLLFPHRAPSQYVHALDSERAQGQLGAGNLIVNDLRRYWAFAAALEMLDPSPLGAAREDALRALVTAVPSYEVGLTRDVTREEASRIVGALCATRPAAARMPASGSARRR